MNPNTSICACLTPQHSMAEERGRAPPTRDPPHALLSEPRPADPLLHPQAAISARRGKFRAEHNGTFHPMNHFRCCSTFARESRAGRLVPLRLRERHTSSLGLERTSSLQGSGTPLEHCNEVHQLKPLAEAVQGACPPLAPARGNKLYTTRARVTRHAHAHAHAQTQAFTRARAHGSPGHT